MRLFIPVMVAGFMFFGCSAHQSCATSFCNTPAATKSVVKKVRVSQCARRIKTVVYNDICRGCEYPVSVRENNCCFIGGCK